MQFVPVVIVAYNEADRLRVCLDSLKLYEPNLPPNEIYVVDNSDDGTVARMMRKHHPDVTYIDHENSGFGVGNNRGVQASTGEVVLLLNPDTELTAPLSHLAVQRFEHDEDLGALGVRLVAPNGRPQQSFFWIDSGGLLKGISQHLLNRLQWFIPRLMCTSGAALFVRRTAFYDIGGFDEDIFLYCEEADLARRLKQRGWRWRLDSRASVLHAGGGTIPSSTFSTQARLNSLSHYCRKYNLNYTRRLQNEVRYIRAAGSIKRLITRSRLDAISDTRQTVDLYNTAIAESLIHGRGA